MNYYFLADTNLFDLKDMICFEIKKKRKRYPTVISNPVSTSNKIDIYGYSATSLENDYYTMFFKMYPISKSNLLTCLKYKPYFLKEFRDDLDHNQG